MWLLTTSPRRRFYSFGGPDPNAITLSGTPAGRHTNRRTARLPAGAKPGPMIPGPAARAAPSHSTIICPFMTIQWPGNVQRYG